MNDILKSRSQVRRVITKEPDFVIKEIEALLAENKKFREALIIIGVCESSECECALVANAALEKA